MYKRFFLHFFQLFTCCYEEDQPINMCCVVTMKIVQSILPYMASWAEFSSFQTSKKVRPSLYSYSYSFFLFLFAFERILPSLCFLCVPQATLWKISTLRDVYEITGQHGGRVRSWQTQQIFSPAGCPTRPLKELRGRVGFWQTQQTGGGDLPQYSLAASFVFKPLSFLKAKLWCCVFNFY